MSKEQNTLKKKSSIFSFFRSETKTPERPAVFEKKTSTENQNSPLSTQESFDKLFGNNIKEFKKRKSFISSIFSHGFVHQYNKFLFKQKYVENLKQALSSSAKLSDYSITKDNIVNFLKNISDIGERKEWLKNLSSSNQRIVEGAKAAINKQFGKDLFLNKNITEVIKEDIEARTNIYEYYSDILKHKKQQGTSKVKTVEEWLKTEPRDYYKIRQIIKSDKKKINNYEFNDKFSQFMSSDKLLEIIENNKVIDIINLKEFFKRIKKHVEKSGYETNAIYQDYNIKSLYIKLIAINDELADFIKKEYNIDFDKDSDLHKRESLAIQNIEYILNFSNLKDLDSKLKNIEKITLCDKSVSIVPEEGGYLVYKQDLIECLENINATNKNKIEKTLKQIYKKLFLNDKKQLKEILNNNKNQFIQAIKDSLIKSFDDIDQKHKKAVTEEKLLQNKKISFLPLLADNKIDEAFKLVDGGEIDLVDYLVQIDDILKNHYENSKIKKSEGEYNTALLKKLEKSLNQILQEDSNTDSKVKITKLRKFLKSKNIDKQLVTREGHENPLYNLIYKGLKEITPKTIVDFIEEGNVTKVKEFIQQHDTIYNIEIKRICPLGNKISHNMILSDFASHIIASKIKQEKLEKKFAEIINIMLEHICVSCDNAPEKSLKELIDFKEKFRKYTPDNDNEFSIFMNNNQIKFDFYQNTIKFKKLSLEIKGKIESLNLSGHRLLNSIDISNNNPLYKAISYGTKFRLKDEKKNNTKKDDLLNLESENKFVSVFGEYIDLTPEDLRNIFKPLMSSSQINLIKEDGLDKIYSPENILKIKKFDNNNLEGFFEISKEELEHKHDEVNISKVKNIDKAWNVIMISALNSMLSYRNNIIKAEDIVDLLDTILKNMAKGWYKQKEEFIKLASSLEYLAVNTSNDKPEAVDLIRAKIEKIEAGVKNIREQFNIQKDYVLETESAKIGKFQASNLNKLDQYVNSTKSKNIDFATVMKLFSLEEKSQKTEAESKILGNLQCKIFNIRDVRSFKAGHQKAQTLRNAYLDGDVNKIKFLTSKNFVGLDQNIKNAKSRNIFHYACKRGRLDLIKILLKDDNLSFNERDNKGKTAIEYLLESIKNNKLFFYGTRLEIFFKQSDLNFWTKDKKTKEYKFDQHKFDKKLQSEQKNLQQSKDKKESRDGAIIGKNKTHTADEIKSFFEFRKQDTERFIPKNRELVKEILADVITKLYLQSSGKIIEQLPKLRKILGKNSWLNISEVYIRALKSDLDQDNSRAMHYIFMTGDVAAIRDFINELKDLDDKDKIKKLCNLDGENKYPIEYILEQVAANNLLSGGKKFKLSNKSQLKSSELKQTIIMPVLDLMYKNNAQILSDGLITILQKVLGKNSTIDLQKIYDRIKQVEVGLEGKVLIEKSGSSDLNTPFYEEHKFNPKEVESFAVRLSYSREKDEKKEERLR